VIYEAISRKPKGHDFDIDREQGEIYVPRHMNVPVVNEYSYCNSKYQR
jgi:hypothetical protein